MTESTIGNIARATAQTEQGLKGFIRRQDPAYQAYMQTVRYRFIPFVF